MGWEVENSRVYYEKGSERREESLEKVVGKRGILAIRHLMEGNIPPRGISHKALHSHLVVGAYVDFEFPAETMAWLGKHYINCKHPIFGDGTRKKILEYFLLGDILREEARHFVLSNPSTRNYEEFRI